MQPFYVYMLRCSDGSYYVGHTDNIEARIGMHKQRIVKGYTSKRLPVKLVFLQEFNTRAEAITGERQIKGWSRQKKEALIVDDWEKIVTLANRKKKIEI